MRSAASVESYRAESYPAENSGAESYRVGHEKKPLIMIVDDEALICSTLKSVLADESYPTITAHDGYEALPLVEAHKPALVFLDIWMPGIDGIQVLERIKAVSPLTEVIIISGHANVSNALEATKRGAFDFIEKPLDIENIMLSLRRALERHDQQLRAAASEGAGEHEHAGKINPVRPVLTHPGMLTTGCAGRNLGQRTLKRSAILYGHCLHSGQKSGLVLEPLPPNSGIHFAKIGHARTVPAFVDFVQSTGFATTVRSGAAVGATIEHLMAALHAYGISNLLIKSNGEIPIFDGSALQFCKTIEEIGLEEQGGEWFEFAVSEPVSVGISGADADTGEFVRVEPAEQLSIRYELNYPVPVGEQVAEFVFESPASFKTEIAPCRTFGFMKDIEKLQKAGLAAGGRLDNFILIGEDKVINTDLRFENELARHKILDALGDLFLLGRPIRARITARMTGHSDNVKLAGELVKLLG